jgi:acetyl esterase
MQLDPQARAVLERAARAGVPSFAQLGAALARAIYRETRGVLASPPPAVARIEDRHAPGPASDIPLRCYRPLGVSDTELLPALVYFHGGGWTLGDLETHDVVCREFANRARCAVVAVDYRLAPEHKFPAAVDDAVAATRWIASTARHLGVDERRIAVGGDSAGGNLAAVVALTLRDDGGPPLAMQALIYPATDLAADTPSHKRLAEGYLLTRESILWFTGNYVRSPADVTDWRASPLKARDLSRLPPAYVVTAGFDPLYDEGHAYAAALQAAGVETTYECFEGMVHGFVTMSGVIAAAHHAIYRVSLALREVFARR